MYFSDYMEGNCILIVGLGNPGEDYARSRHNVGFMALDRLKKHWNLDDFREDKKHSCLLSMGNLSVGSEVKRVVLCKPLTYMNLSGEAVTKVKSYYKIKNEDIFVIYDDVDLPFASLRVRKKGGPGTHNGLKSVVSHLGQEFPRVRIGIGEPYPPQKDLATYVLEPFSKTELGQMDDLLDAVPGFFEGLVSKGLDHAMSIYNKV